MDIITEVDLQEKTDVAAKKLSGGQKRKLSVGIALIGDPKIIFVGKYFMHMKYVLIGYTLGSTQFRVPNKRVCLNKQVMVS